MRLPEHHHEHGPQVSLLVPFREDKKSPHRTRVWNWLMHYWSFELPDAEIVIGRSPRGAFSKTAAINDAASRATGRVFVILDADAYLPGETITDCATRIDHAVRRGEALWFVPYRHLYRLTEQATLRFLTYPPREPLQFPTPPPIDEVSTPESASYGHHFGAMIQIMPREAFETVGCMDPRFVGWGSEDICFVRAVDTLYGRHKTVDTKVMHLWHAREGNTSQDRRWQGQTRDNPNANLAARYNAATGDRVRMRRLVDEGCATRHRPPWPRRWALPTGWGWWPSP